MSTAANHRKRSHKSHYRSKAFSGSGKRSVITPTIGKSATMQIIGKIAKFFNKKDGEV